MGQKEETQVDSHRVTLVTPYENFVSFEVGKIHL